MLTHDLSLPTGEYLASFGHLFHAHTFRAMFKKTQYLVVAALLTLAVGCSKNDAAVPAPTAAPGQANNVAPIDPTPGGGGSGGYGGGGGSQPPCNVAPTLTIKNGIKRYVMLEAPARGWTVVKTITPPDGITYGTGCNYSYPFSVDIIIDQTQQSTFAQGTYNSSTNTYTLDL